MFGRTTDQTVRIAGEETSREALMERACALAGSLGGAKAVAVNATPTLDTVIAVVGGLLAGVPVVPLPPDSGPAERTHILTDSGAELLLGAEDFGLPRVDVPASGSATALPDVPDSTTALILYTSGT